MSNLAGDKLVNKMSLSEKMDSISAKITSTLDLSDDLEANADEIISSATAVSSTSVSSTSAVNIENISQQGDVIELIAIVDDFKFIRSTLKENTINARRLLSKLTLELTDSCLAECPETITSFSEINKVIIDNMKLYVDAYKGISASLININKINSSSRDKKTADNRGIGSAKKISTVDLLSEL